jgi:hypothetical protein
MMREREAPNRGAPAAPNDGTHPTRGAVVAIYFQRLGRARDAGR